MLTYCFESFYCYKYIFQSAFVFSSLLTDCAQWNIWSQRFVKECFVECRLLVGIIQDLSLVTLCALRTEWAHWHWWTQIACICTGTVPILTGVSIWAVNRALLWDCSARFEAKSFVHLVCLLTSDSISHWRIFLSLSRVSTETCASSQLDPKPLIAHVARPIKSSKRPQWPKRDVFTLCYQSAVWSVVASPPFLFFVVA